MSSPIVEAPRDISAILPSRISTEPETISSSRIMRAFERTVSLVMSASLSAWSAAQWQPGTDDKGSAACLFDEYGNACHGKRLANMSGECFAQDRVHDRLPLCCYRPGQRHVEAEFVHDIWVAPPQQVGSMRLVEFGRPAARDICVGKRRAQRFESFDHTG